LPELQLWQSPKIKQHIKTGMLQDFIIYIRSKKNSNRKAGKMEKFYTQKKHLEITIAHKKQIAEVLKRGEIVEIFKKWQDKKYSKRLETSLKKIDNHFFIDNFGDLNYCFYGLEERYISEINAYIKYNKYNILPLFSPWDAEKIIRQDVAENLNDACIRFSENVEKLKNQEKNLDAIISEFEKIRTMRRDFEKNTAFQIRDIFNLNF
jgi:hypothetical protein